MASPARGYFISFEGVEGVGKSTQSRLLGEALQQAGRTVVLTREPGGSDGAEEIRRLLVNGQIDRWDAMTETLLLLAARRDHVVKIIRPALERGDWVICDRFTDSTLAYQGYGHGLDLGVLRSLSDQVLASLSADVTLILDMPVDAGLERAADRRGGEDRYERMDTAFHERVRRGFLEIAREDAIRCSVVDGSKAIPKVYENVRDAVTARLPEAFA